MKETTKKLLKAIACMAGCAAISGVAGKGMDYIQHKIINGEPEPDDGHVPTEAEAAELAEAYKPNTEEEMIEEIITETEEESEEKE